MEQGHTGTIAFFILHNYFRYQMEFFAKFIAMVGTLFIGKFYQIYQFYQVIMHLEINLHRHFDYISIW